MYRTLVVATTALALLAIVPTAFAQSGARITKTVNVYSMPSAGIDAVAKIVPRAGCPTERPIIGVYTAPTAMASGEHERFYMVDLKGATDGWVNARSVKRTAHYKVHVCGTVTGDVKPGGTTAERERFQRIVDKLHILSQQLGVPLHINSGYRTYAEQAALYRRFLSGNGAPANPPGHSEHEAGAAADVEIGNIVGIGDGSHSLGSNPRAKRLARALGFKFPHSREPWHMELR